MTLVRIQRGHLRGCTGRVVSVTADDVRIELTAARPGHGRYVRVPRDGGWYESVDETPMTAAQARERRAS